MRKIGCSCCYYYNNFTLTPTIDQLGSCICWQSTILPFDWSMVIRVKNPEDASVISLFVSRSAHNLIQPFLGVWQKWKHALKFSNLYFQSIRLFVVDIPTYIPFTKHSYLTRKDSNQSSQHSSLRVLAGYWVCHVIIQLKISSLNL